MKLSCKSVFPKNSTRDDSLNVKSQPYFFVLSSVGVYVENLSEFVVRSPSEVLNLLTVGKKRLVFAETKMNRNSSRFEIQLYVKIIVN